MCSSAPVLPNTVVTVLQPPGNLVMYKCTNGRPIQNGFYTKTVPCACTASDWQWLLHGLNNSCNGGT